MDSNLMLLFEVVHLAVSVAILLVLIDSEYGYSSLKRAGKRKFKRNFKKFMRTTTEYFKGV